MAHNPLLVNQIPCRSNMEENAQLHASVVAGDKAARQRMIEGNMPLVLHKVEALLKRNPNLEYLRDDLVSAGFVRLVSAVDDIAKLPREDANMVAGYIVACVTNGISDEIEASGHIRVARRSMKRLHSGGETLPEVTELEHGHFEKKHDDFGLTELRDTLEACCRSDCERTLLEMREAGYGVKEIASRLGISRASAYRLLRDIESRLNQKLKELR